MFPLVISRFSEPRKWILLRWTPPSVTRIYAWSSWKAKRCWGNWRPPQVAGKKWQVGHWIGGKKIRNLLFLMEKTMVSCNPSTNPVGWGCRWIFVTFRKAGGQFTIFPWTVWFYGDENDERTIYRPWYAVVMQLAIGLGNPTLCHDGKSTWKLLAKHPEMDHFPLGTLVKNQRVNFRVNRRWKPHMI